jgi:hypothetical protein
MMAYEDDSDEETSDHFYVTCVVCNHEKENTMLILGQHRCAASTDLFLASALAMAFFTPCSAILTQSYGKSI